MWTGRGSMSNVHSYWLQRKRYRFIISTYLSVEKLTGVWWLWCVSTSASRLDFFCQGENPFMDFRRGSPSPEWAGFTFAGVSAFGRRLLDKKPLRLVVVRPVGPRKDVFRGIYGHDDVLGRFSSFSPTLYWILQLEAYLAFKIPQRNEVQNPSLTKLWNIQTYVKKKIIN